MHCPFCSAIDTKVIDSRLVSDGYQVRRRRECLLCHERFTTFEIAELVTPKIIKSNDNRVPFDEKKLRSGMMRAPCVWARARIYTVSTRSEPFAPLALPPDWQGNYTTR